MLKKIDSRILIFWTVILSVHIVYFTIAIFSNNIYMADSYEYLQQAYNIKNFSSLYCLDFSQPINMLFYTKRPPLYGMFILIAKLFINSNYSVLFFQNILSVINVLGILKILKIYPFSFDLQKFFIFILILLPVQFIYNNMIMSEILLQTLLFWSFYYFLMYLEKDKLNYVFVYNIFLALAVLTKPVLLYFWIPNLLLSIYLVYKKRKAIIILAGLIIPVVIFSFSLYNYHTTGCFHYSSIKQMNLVGYNIAFLYVKVYGEEEGIKKIVDTRKHLDSINNFSKLIKEEDKIGYEMIMSHIYDYTKYHIGGMVNFFLDPGRFDFNNFFGVKEKNNTGLLYTFTKDGYWGVLKFILKQPAYIITYLIIMFVVNIVMVVSLTNFLFVKCVKTELKVFMFLLVFYLCFFAGPLGTMRYKVHIIPLLLFTIPFLFERIKTKFKKTEKI
jgi:hypothetical protein